MTGETVYTIEVTYDEIVPIGSLLELLDDCPISLTNDDYVSIFRAIANHWADVDNIDNLKISYKESENQKERVAKVARELDPIVNAYPCDKCSDDIKITCNKCDDYYKWISRLKGDME